MLDQLVPTVVSHFATFYGTGMGLLARMSSLVIILVSTSRELHRADLASIWLFSSVHSRVNLFELR